MSTRARIVRLAIALLGAAAAPALGQDGAGSSSAVLLQLAPAPRPVALGGAYAAVAADPYALFYNPAGVAAAGRGVGAAYQAYPAGVAAGSLAGALSFGRLGLALGVHYLDLGEVDVLEPDPVYGGQRGRPTGEVVGGGEVLAAGGLAFALTPTLYVGAGAKALRLGLAGETGSGFAADLGATAMLFADRLRIGAAVQNLGPDLGPGRASPLPRTVRAGAALELGGAAGLRTTLALDAVHVEGTTSIATGLEAGYRAAAGLAVLARAGFDGRARSHDAASPLTLGGGLVLGRFRLDYAYRGVGPLGATHHFGFSFHPAGAAAENQ